MAYISRFMNTVPCLICFKKKATRPSACLSFFFGLVPKHNNILLALLFKILLLQAHAISVCPASLSK
jgi:hypothetical protein